MRTGLIKKIFIFFGLNIIIHSTAGLAALFGLIPIPFIGFILLMPFLIGMLLFASLMMGCNILIWIKHFFGFIIAFFIGDGIIDSFKILLGYGYIASIVGLPLMAELIGWINVIVLLILRCLSDSLIIDTDELFVDL